MNSLNAKIYLKDFERKLEAAETIEDSEEIFVQFVKNYHLRHIISNALSNLANDSFISLGKLNSRNSLVLINNRKFSYSVSFLTKHSEIEKKMLWTGGYWMIALRGSGKAKLQFYKAPKVDINNFEHSQRLEPTECVELQTGDFYINKDERTLFKIEEIRGPIILETLEIIKQGAQIQWVFDHNLQSISPISSKQFLIRAMLLLQAAVEMKVKPNDELFRIIIENGDINMKIHALHLLKETGNRNLKVDFIEQASTSPTLAYFNKLVIGYHEDQAKWRER